MTKRIEPTEAFVLRRLKSCRKTRGDRRTRLPFRIEGTEVSVGSGLGRGAIDIIAHDHGTTWAIEAKGHCNGGSFWSATKSIAYSRVYNKLTGERTVPAVLLPHGEVSVGVLLYAQLADVDVFSWDEEDGILTINRHRMPRCLG